MTISNANPLGVTPVFRKLKQAEADGKTVIVSRGGARSSKSHSICQLLIERLFGSAPRKILICRKTLPSLRVSTLSLFEEVLESYGLTNRVRVNRGMMNWKFRNNLIHFGGLDDPEKIKCYHPDTEILTKDRGFVFIENLKKGDIVATMNPDTRVASYKPVSEMYSYDYSGDMYKPKDKSIIDFCVTPEHKMLVRLDGQTKYKRVCIKEISSCFIPTDKKEVYLENIQTVKYTGKVYCPTVPPFHNVMTRFNNRVMWCGQSSEWNDIWMEEATDFTYADYMALLLRQSAPTYGGPLNQLILSFNPVDEYHWIKEKIVDGNEAGMIELVSTFKDNPYLSKEYLRIINELKQQSKNYWRIYGLGEWGKLDNLIFDKWDIVSKDSIPENGNSFYGVDFGFNVPSAVLKMTLDNYDLWVEPKLYETGLTNNQLIERLLEIIPKEDRGLHPIYADAQEPQRIEEIRMAGFWCEKATKDVKPGLDFCQRLNDHIVDSDEAEPYKKEIKGYSWMTDQNGRPQEAPIKFNDHYMDAKRYGAYTFFEQQIGCARIRSL